MGKKKHDVPEELPAGLLANYKNPEDLIGEEGLLKHLTKLVVERALEAELSEHLGHDKHARISKDDSNRPEAPLKIVSSIRRLKYEDFLNALPEQLQGHVQTKSELYIFRPRLPE